MSTLRACTGCKIGEDGLCVHLPTTPGMNFQPSTKDGPCPHQGVHERRELCSRPTSCKNPGHVCVPVPEPVQWICTGSSLDCGLCVGRKPHRECSPWPQSLRTCNITKTEVQCIPVPVLVETKKEKAMPTSTSDFDKEYDVTLNLRLIDIYALKALNHTTLQRFSSLLGNASGSKLLAEAISKGARNSDVYCKLGDYIRDLGFDSETLPEPPTPKVYETTLSESGYGVEVQPEDDYIKIGCWTGSLSDVRKALKLSVNITGDGLQWVGDSDTFSFPDNNSISVPAGELGHADVSQLNNWLNKEDPTEES